MIPMRSCFTRLVPAGPFLLILATASPVAAQKEDHHHADADLSQLGTLDWPTTATAKAHGEFIRGVLYLHSFHYEQAAEAFRAAQKSDPGDVMSYWGEAMSYTHPVWNQQDTAAARTALRRLAPSRSARLAKARSEIEKQWLDAVETLYAGDLAKARRDTVYAAAMERLHGARPQDPEAATFFALALIGLNQGQRDTVTYGRAFRIVDSVFQAHPDHPGAAHYLIHAVDDPDHAQLGLSAARRYSSIAPAAAHAQHMTSHIFMALGLWDDVVAANEHALARLPYLNAHPTTWLVYGLIQQGRYREAERWADSMAAQAKRSANDRVESNFALADMAAGWNASTNRWSDRIARLRPDTAGNDASIVLIGTGLGALGRGDRALADSMLREITRMRVEEAARRDTLTNVQPWDVKWYGLVRIREGVLRAMILRSQGNRDSAVALLRPAASLEDSLPVEFGPPNTYKPSHEALGEVLSELGQHALAEREFRLALLRTPRRPAALLGLARSLVAQGKQDDAARQYAELVEIWKQADAAIPEVAEAQAGSKKGGSFL